MISCVVVGLLIVFLVHQFWWRRRNLPPGPVPLPVLGSLFSLMYIERWEDKFLEWREKYGKVYSLFMGNMLVITVNDYQLMQEMFVKDGESYADRAPTEVLEKYVRGGPYGIIASSGELWRQQRRFALKVFRDFGLSKSKMEERVLEEFETIRGNIDAEIKAGIVDHDFHKHTDIATGSLINNVVCGFRFTTNNRQALFYKLKHVSESIMRSFSNPLLLFTLTNESFARLPFFRGPFDECVNLHLEIRNFLESSLDEHLKTTDYSDENFQPSDYIDAFLYEQKKEEAKGGLTYFTRTQLLATCLDLWIAGQETTSTTLTWGFAYLICHPEAQQKLHEELDRVIGSDRLITMADRNDLPYTNAVVMEIQRCANILAQNVPRKTTRDVNVEGYHVPKGTIVIPQVSVLMVSPEIFPEPKRFNPSRFIDENGKLKRCDELMPFSLGKRQCLGEGLARMELFLFIANLCNQYKLFPADQPPTLKKSCLGFSLSTEPYNCRVQRRY